MAGLAKVLEFTPATNGTARPASCEEEPAFAPARLIPGSDLDSKTGDTHNRQYPVTTSFFASTHMARLFPDALKLIDPSKLGTAVFDLIIVAMVVFALQRAHQVDATTSGAYLLLFFASALHSNLYRTGDDPLETQLLAFAKALIWPATLTWLLTGSLHRGTPAALALASLACVCLLTFGRLLCRALHIGSDAGRNVLVIGEAPFGQKVIDAVHRHSCSTLCVKGFLPEQSFGDAFGAQMLRTLARQECIDEVIVATQSLEWAQEILRHARRNHLSAQIAFDWPTFTTSGTERIGNVTLLPIYELPLPQWKLAFKRLCDLTLATCALIMTSPLLLLISAAIKLDSAGPVLYRSVRIGQRGRRFTCYKFRSMRQNADAEKRDLRALNERQGAFFKIARDPRVTAVGNFLRRYSLDELPQLWNVVRGEMSLVGPRPHPPDDVAGYSEEHLQRLDFIPGMTGLWQVTARQDPSFERCVALDVEYIKRWSPALDFRILGKTVMAVLQGSGA
jgi:exopolysaccharide biosynthesis polyprenyl glycosylphosphotransferase